MTEYSKLKKRIKKHEGFRNKIYLDQLGHPTIGYGHLILPNEKHLLKTTKSKKDLDSVALVREYIKGVKGFKSVSIVYRDKNYGMSNITEGLNEISKKYPQFIVVEDDIVTSPYFLNFMNKALELYKDNKKIWHIS